MRYTATHKQRTREAILDAAGRVFRAEGYGGSGIDALTKAAGVTNGAFYGHFKTKAEAFRTVVALGLRGLADAVAQMRADHGRDWLAPFVAFYLGSKLTCDLGDACSLPMLSTEVARADLPARQAYESEYRHLVATVADGLDGDAGRAMAVLALLSGAATAARAVVDPDLRDQIVRAAQLAATRLGKGFASGDAG